MTCAKVADALTVAADLTVVTLVHVALTEAPAMVTAEPVTTARTEAGAVATTVALAVTAVAWLSTPPPT